MLKFFKFLFIFFIILSTIQCFTYNLKQSLTKDSIRKKFFNTLKQIQKSVWLQPKFKETTIGETEQPGQTLALKEFRFADDKLMISYYGDIRVGDNEQNAQSFKVLFDTGSTDFFLPDAKCKDPSCIEHAKYDKQKSTTFKMVDDKPKDIEYISGKLKSYIGSDYVYLGNITVPDQAIHLGFQVDIPIFSQAVWDGIVGLGFTPANEKVPYDTLVDNLEQRSLIQNKFFAFYLPDESGYITFGELPQALVKEDQKINWAPLISNNENPWSIKLKNIHIKRDPDSQISFLQKNSIKTQIKKRYRFKEKRDQRMLLAKKKKHQDLDTNVYQAGNPCQANGCEFLVDTGTYLTYVPIEMYKHFFKGFDQDYAEKCENMINLPNINFEVQGVGGKTFHLVLEPKDYVIKYTDDNGESTCVLGISPDDQVQHLITIGQELLRAFVTIFDFDKKQIGFYDMSNNVKKEQISTNETSNKVKIMSRPMKQSHQQQQTNIQPIIDSKTTYESNNSDQAQSQTQPQQDQYMANITQLEDEIQSFDLQQQFNGDIQNQNVNPIETKPVEQTKPFVDNQSYNQEVQKTQQANNEIQEQIETNMQQYE